MVTLISGMLKHLPGARPNINEVLAAPVMARPIADVCSKYPELLNFIKFEDLEDECMVTEEEPMMSRSVLETFQYI